MIHEHFLGFFATSQSDYFRFTPETSADAKAEANDDPACAALRVSGYSEKSIFRLQIAARSRVS